jgi:hypothetical protein
MEYYKSRQAHQLRVDCHQKFVFDIFFFIADANVLTFFSIKQHICHFFFFLCKNNEKHEQLRNSIFLVVEQLILSAFGNYYLYKILENPFRTSKRVFY